MEEGRKMTLKPQCGGSAIIPTKSPGSQAQGLTRIRGIFLSGSLENLEMERQMCLLLVLTQAGNVGGRISEPMMRADNGRGPSGLGKERGMSRESQKKKQSEQEREEEEKEKRSPRKEKIQK